MDKAVVVMEAVVAVTDVKGFVALVNKRKVSFSQK